MAEHPWSGLACFPLLVPDFIAEAERTQALGFLAAHEADFGATDRTDYWAGRTLTLPQVRDPATRTLLRELQQRIIRTVHSVLEERLGPQPPLYADAENPGGEPHPYPWRHFASVIYLNDDYGDGAIHFPELGIELRHTLASFLTFDPAHAFDPAHEST